VQGLLFPEVLELSPVEWETAHRVHQELERLGFNLEDFGRHTLMVKSIPSLFSAETACQVLLDIIRDLMEEETSAYGEKKFESVLKVTACHGAIRAGKELSKEEMTRLTQEMEKQEFFQTCPHGRPAFVQVALPQLERMFKRSS
jgi:DNA mismatch repair protein MutL